MKLTRDNQRLHVTLPTSCEGSAMSGGIILQNNPAQEIRTVDAVLCPEPRLADFKTCTGTLNHRADADHVHLSERDIHFLLRLMGAR